MGDLWTYLVSAAVVGVVSPLAMIVCIMLLTSRRPLGNALAYLLGWTLILTLLAVLGLRLLEPGRVPGAGGEGAKAALDLMVGLVLLAMGVRSLAGSHHPLKQQLRHDSGDHAAAPEPAHDAPPKWLTGLDTIRPVMALVLGAAMIVMNPANLAVFLSSLQSIATADITAGTRMTAAVILVVCMDLALLLPIGVYALLPARSAALLGRAREWLMAHERAATAAVSLAFGALFLLKGVATAL